MGYVVYLYMCAVDRVGSARISKKFVIMEISIQTIVQHAQRLSRCAAADDVRSEQGNNVIVLWSLGSMLVAYGDSARDLCTVLRLNMEVHVGIPECSFPAQVADTYFPRLIVKGYKICIDPNK